MLILNKKRIIFLNLVIVFSILFQSIKYKEKNITFSSTPVSNHIIIIDAGHGFPDGGATGIDGSTIEANLNLKIALKLQKLLDHVFQKVKTGKQLKTYTLKETI